MTLSPLLHRLAMANTPRLVLALRPQDPLPEWITHLVYLDKECRIAHQGRKDEMLIELEGKINSVGKLPAAEATENQVQVATPEPEGELISSSNSPGMGRDEDLEYEEPHLSYISKAEAKEGIFNRRSLGMTERSRKRRQKRDLQRSSREVLVNMEGVCVKYGDKTVLGNWTQDSDEERTPGLWWDVRRGDRWGIFGPNG